MIITIQVLTHKYDCNTDIPYNVWETIKRATRNAVYWAKEGDYLTMLDAIDTAENAIAMYNNMLSFFRYDIKREAWDRPIEYYQLTGYNKIAYLIEAIYKKNRIPF